MAKMMGRNTRRGYCHCCNPVAVVGRTAEKRFWAAELNAEARSEDAEYEYLRKRSLIADELERIENTLSEKGIYDYSTN